MGIRDQDDVIRRVSGSLTGIRFTSIFPCPHLPRLIYEILIKFQLYSDILAMREQGMSYRKIGVALGIHFTRVRQIIKILNSDNSPLVDNQ